MKIVIHPPKLIVRIRIYIGSTRSEYSNDAHYINLEETTLEDVLEMVKKSIKEKDLSAMGGCRSTHIDIREYMSGKPIKGRSKSFSFKGMDPKETNDLIITNINEI